MRRTGNIAVICGNGFGTRPAYARDVADIFDDYRLADAWDEMFAAPGEPRAPYDALVSVLQPMDPAELRFRADQLARVFTDRGVTFDYGGEERPFPLDLIPRVIDAVEWDLVARGVRQRVLALEAFLADVYGPGRVFDDGVVPWRLLLPRRGSAGRSPDWNRRTAFGYTSRGSIWSGTRPGGSGFSRTTSGSRPGSAT